MKIGYRFGNGYSLSPGRVYIVLTGRCNLKCQMCPQDNHPSFRNETNKERDSNTKELQKIIDDVSSFHPIIFVSGGELFLHPSWYDFLSYIRKKGLYFGIVTNGTLLGKNATRLVETGLHEVNVSVDGPEHVHDEIRGAPGGYSKSVEGIKRVIEEKKRVGVNKPLINVIFTITTLNYRYINTMVELMVPLKIDKLIINHLNFLRQEDFDAQMKISRELFGIDHDTSWAGYVSDVHNIDAGYVANTIENIRNSRNGNLEITFGPNFNKEEIIQYYSDVSFLAMSFKKACSVVWDVALIGPKGEVVLCPNYVIGNLHEDSFQKIWNNKRARYFRKVILRKKRMPACSRGCCFFHT